MQVYRFLTGPDETSFCRKVTEALQKGWQLHGSPSVSNGPYGTVCGQAVVKDVPAYDPKKPLSHY